MHIICELEVQFKPEAEEDLEYFNKRDRQKLKKIALLLEDIKKHPFSGTANQKRSNTIILAIGQEE